MSVSQSSTAIKLTVMCSVYECITELHSFPFVGDRNVIRDCAENCRPSSPDNLGIVRPTRCCQSDMCNISSEAPSIGAILLIPLLDHQ
uniref:Snake toxin/toxin-like domain-containing protein n=1 Tax=Leptobrachium leishanense TaxID=445787 RepID=A0A8C5MY48_9ANUR